MPSPAPDPAVLDADVEAVLAGARALVAVAAHSVAGAGESLTLPQLRALMILATRGPASLSELADELGVHPSNATRACDRLVAAQLVDRRENPADRRHLLLDLTADGRALIDGVVARRRAEVARILRHMPPLHRRALGRALAEFAAAAGEPRSSELWTLGWVG